MGDWQLALLKSPPSPGQALSEVAAGEQVVRRPSYLDLFRTPRLRYISLCCMVVW